MEKNPMVLTLNYSYSGAGQQLHPAVLFGEQDTVLVDCGYPGSLDQLEAELAAHGIPPHRLTRLVLTHQDDDHMGAAAELREKYPALRILASPAEAPYISGERKNLRLQQAEDLQDQLPDSQKEFGRQFCARLRQVRTVPVDETLSPGSRFDWCGGCEILATPGHTPGHLSIRALDNRFLVTGDAAVIENGALALANPEFCLDLPKARESLEQVRAYRSRRYLCYHGGLFPP